MENILMVASCIAFIYLLIKLIDIKYIKKEEKPLKVLLIDSIIVFISVIIGNILLEQFGNYNSSGISKSVPIAFTSTPDF